MSTAPNISGQTTAQGNQPIPMRIPNIAVIPSISLQQDKLLGEGGYGQVYLGKWNGGEVAILRAARFLKNSTNFSELKV